MAINDFYLPARAAPYPLGQIQSQGRTHAIMAKVVGDTWSYKGIAMRHIPLWAYDAWVSRATDWLAMTEDLPHAGQPRDAGARRPHRARTTARTTSRAHAPARG